jgi:hypothetical protein
MRTLLLLFFLVSSSVAFTQDPADIFHKTVDLDSINQVSFDIYTNDQFEVRPWPGDDILIETSVVLNNGEPHILKFFMKKLRWDLEPEVNGNQLKLESGDKVRRVVQGTEGSTSETVSIVIYMPEDFTEAGGVYHRKQQ